MSYFTKISRLPVYLDADGSFRFTYNANSGGGQSFLAGKLKDRHGAITEPRILNEKHAVFKVMLQRMDQKESHVILSDSTLSYLVKPRGGESSSMKLEVNGKINPSKALTALFMLPEGCTVGRPTNPTHSALAKGNYWLQQMRLAHELSEDNSDVVYLIPSDLIYSGGNAESNIYFKLDTDRRFRDIFDSAKAEALPQKIREPLQFFVDIFTGSRRFIYSEANEKINVLMRETALQYPTQYSGIEDPLPLLVALSADIPRTKRSPQTRFNNTNPRNLIIFGAPGTGKSTQLNLRAQQLLLNGGAFERVTFHADYTYAHFVGTYKPVTITDHTTETSLTYEYVPGPFMRVLAAALKNRTTGMLKPHVLLIEEINRAPAAAVFGDIFQLLDRNHFHASEYPIHPSSEIQRYLAKVIGGSPQDFTELHIPDNMFIWCSMNSADQGVFPMDTAFKRRWDFVYIGIDDNDIDLADKLVTLGKDDFKHTVEWNSLRKAINRFLADKGINEDKQIGPYFLRRDISVPLEGTHIAPEPFIDAFQQKVLMYLFEDAARHHRTALFAGCAHKGLRYSHIRDEFARIGIRIFNPQIVDDVIVHN